MKLGGAFGLLMTLALGACRSGANQLPPPDPAPPVGPEGAEVDVPVSEGGMPRQAPVPSPDAGARPR